MVRPTRWSRTADCLATSSPGIGRRPADTDRQMIVGRPGPALHGSPAWAVHARPTPPALRREVRPGVPPPGPGECQAMAFDDELRLDMAEVVKAMERTEAMFSGMNFGHRG